MTKHPFKMNSIHKNHYIKRNKTYTNCKSIQIQNQRTGLLTINGNSTITITNSSTAPEIAIALIELRIANTNNKNTAKILNKIIHDINLSDEDIDKILIENNENNEVFATKILKTLEKYKDDTTSTIARIIGKHCNRESLNKKRNKTKNNLKPITKRRHNNKNANRTKNMFNSRQL